MRVSESDRVRVAGVRINRNGRQHEIPNCWIEVSASQAAIGIWLTADADAPALTVPLADAEIEWGSLDVPMP